MLLFVSALGGAKKSYSTENMQQPLLVGDTSSHVSVDRSYSSDRFNSTGRGKSFTEVVENIANKLSVSLNAEEFQEGNDELTPLRSMSVA